MISISSLLDTSRQALLDLSTRNRLLSIPKEHKNTKIIEIRDKLSAEVYRLLVADGKALSFLPGREKQKPVNNTLAEDEGKDDFGELPQPEDGIMGERGIAKRHNDHHLQT